MTNYEKIKTLTLEQMAEINVRAVSDDYYSKMYYDTTDGNRFYTRDQAESYERSWLQQEEDSMVFG